MSLADAPTLDETIGTRDALRAAGLSTASAGDYIQLLKPRVMSLVVFTALVGLVAAPGTLHPLFSFTAILCIGIGGGASGALNMWYDADIDAVMGRTAKRPIPSGAVSARNALAFGLVLSVFSVLALGLFINWAASALLAFTIIFYALVYTMWLKRLTPQNIVIGGLAGAFPPAIGWLSVTGTLTLEPILMVAIIFIWTPPHFWALALLKADDYGRAGVPMMPNVAGDRSTRNQIFGYSLVLAPFAVLPAVFGFTGVLYGVASILGGIAFVYRANILRVAPDMPTRNKAAGKLFGYSIAYLFGLFLIMLGEDLVSRLFGMSWNLPSYLIVSVGG